MEEPLKNKEGYVESWQIRDKKDVHPSHITKVFEEKDIKSAVEFLKEKLIENPDNKRFISMSKEHCFKLIDKSFEDVK